MAFEIAPGGKLYNVVMEGDCIGKELERSGIKKRVTFVLLNKVCTFKISTEVHAVALLSTPGH